jgi:hypothetical protein
LGQLSPTDSGVSPFWILIEPFVSVASSATAARGLSRLRIDFFASFDFRLLGFKNAADVARQKRSVDERENAVERPREFIRLNYMTGNEVARRIGVRETTIYSWLSGNSTPRDARRIIAF